MNLTINNENLQIKLTFLEQFLAFRFRKNLEIPLAHIKQVTTTKPQSSWKDLRSPGTSIPGVISAGTFYTNRGKEFWYVTKDINYLVIELKDESYQRIILNIDDNQFWQQTLTQQTVA
ncbi:MAG: PH domain-containing protein [Gloeocapsa sp. UFS-A4-WI-NPMV-4B04]|jgi:hypothetical protein|nr:PH domain-containing protein [Gloeocapsa sp. UFS-A4-WI-NPMV-4B04]